MYSIPSKFRKSDLLLKMTPVIYAPTMSGYSDCFHFQNAKTVKYLLEVFDRYRTMFIGGGTGGALAPSLFFQGGPNLRVYFYNIASA